MILATPSTYVGFILTLTIEMIEIDQSSKIERTSQNTVLAMCDGHKRTILIPARVKREALAMLRSNGKGRNIAYYQLFAVGLFILLEPHLHDIIKHKENIMIDKEYVGQEDKIKGMLLGYAHSKGLDLSKRQVFFAQVGKKSAAHKMAWEVQRGDRKADCIIKLDDLLPFL